MSTDNSQVSVPARPVLDEQKQKTARWYAARKRILGLAESVFSLVIMLAIIFSGFSSWFAGLLDWPVPAAAVFYFLVLIIAGEIIEAPLSYYSGFVLPKRVGLSTQKPGGWVSDRLKSGMLGLVLGSLIVGLVFWLLSVFPETWWLIAWFFLLAFTLLMSVIAPLFLVPIFFKVKPLAEGDLKQRLEKLARKAGARINGVFVLDFSSRGTTANAALMGMGKTRRIVISDTLIARYPENEIEVITAHEIGHHTNYDIFRLFLIRSAVYLVVLFLVSLVLPVSVGPLGFSGISDPASLPWLGLVFGTLSMLIGPLLNTYTRHIETQADAYSLSLTSMPGPFIDAMTRLTNQNLAVAVPPAWEELLFHDHPTYRSRVALARKYAEHSGSPY